MANEIKGSKILLESLINQGVDTIFGYPGGQIMPVYDALYDYSDRLRHILVRHEQGAVHAAQAYARVQMRPGVVMVTSGPGATNVITGIADAMIDSTPIVVLAGQVSNAALGTDAFQETDLIGLTTPITKWAHQIRNAKEIPWAVARAFYIAGTGRPGPVVLDITKDAQVGMAEYVAQKCSFIRSYVPVPEPGEYDIDTAVSMINNCERPFVVYGHGIQISGAEKELEAFLDKADAPAGSTLLGLSSIDSDNPHYKGMLGMHGSLAANAMTQNCDLLIAVGMRFDDRVTGVVKNYAPNARVIHIDIDASEIGKNVRVDLGLQGDAKQVLERITKKIHYSSHDRWNAFSNEFEMKEKEKVIEPEINPSEGMINPGEVVDRIAGACGGNAIIITDVGQNQMLAARYSRFRQTHSFISSGGLGTMGFGLPAAIGAKTAAPERPVILFVGDGGLQMTIQEFGTIMQDKIGVKIVLLNNNWLGNVRQWQELFFGQRYSSTRMMNPDFAKIAEAYGIGCAPVEKREELMPAIQKMLSDNEPFLLDVHVSEEDNVFPMVPPGKAVDQIMLNKDEWM